MPGNSSRRGARRTTSKRGASVGSGGKNREGLKGRGKTLPAGERPWHKAYSGDEPTPKRTAWKQEKEKRAAEAARPAARGGGRRVARVVPGRRSTPPRDAAELLVGRNPVLEALRTHIPGTALYVAHGIEVDDRMTEIVRTAADRGLPVLEVSRAELDRMTGGVLHQGVGLQVPPFAYEPFEDLLAAAIEAPTPPLLVGLDGVTDPRNLGAVVRSAVAFGAHGVFLPERRAAGMTATAWRTSAGAAARIPIGQVTNLTRSIKRCQQEGFLAVGLDADGPTSVYDLEAAVGPLVVVVGSEGRGLSRLVGETCDLRVRIPTTSAVESLNASVAAAVVLAEVARRRSTTAL
jgi:23S rRNA (guanosine2251-2'-O)-methyltransferase